jgi:NAD(P)-dependent dehydrogenase (short-subunit alcohol dehydrogenase family)
MRTATMSTAIVTGGSKGLGLALTKALVNRGWNVVADARDAAELESAIGPLGPAALGIAGDVADPAHREELVRRTLEVFGGIDAVIANASTLGPVPMPRLAELAPADLQAVLDVNVSAPLGLVQLALPYMNNGTVVFVTSDAGANAYPGWGAYGTSKAALEHLGAILAQEQPQLRVLVVDPGDMRTRMHADAFFGDDISDRPLPEVRVPAFVELIEGDAPSGRYVATEVLKTASLQEVK